MRRWAADAKITASIRAGGGAATATLAAGPRRRSTGASSAGCHLPCAVFEGAVSEPQVIGAATIARRAHSTGQAKSVCPPGGTGCAPRPDPPAGHTTAAPRDQKSYQRRARVDQRTIWHSDGVAGSGTGPVASAAPLARSFARYGTQPAARARQIGGAADRPTHRRQSRADGRIRRRFDLCQPATGSDILPGQMRQASNAWHPGFRPTARRQCRHVSRISAAASWRLEIVRTHPPTCCAAWPTGDPTGGFELRHFSATWSGNNFISRSRHPGRASD